MLECSVEVCISTFSSQVSLIFQAIFLSYGSWAGKYDNYVNSVLQLLMNSFVRQSLIHLNSLLSVIQSVSQESVRQSIGQSDNGQSVSQSVRQSDSHLSINQRYSQEDSMVGRKSIRHAFSTQNIHSHSFRELVG